MLLGARGVSGGAALALAAAALLGTSGAHHENRPLAVVAVDGGEVTLVSGRADLQGSSALGYLVARNTSDRPVQIVAITSSDASNVGWTTKRQVVTLADLYTAGSVCSPDAALQAAANRQTKQLRDLFVPAHGTLTLRPGTGSLSFSGIAPTVHRGSSIAVQLYLAGPSVPSGTQLTSALRAT